MRHIRLFLVHLPPAARAMALTAAASAFPGAEIIDVDSVEEAGQRAPVRHPDLLVLADPDEVAATSAILAVDASGLPRWVVVVMGRDPSELIEPAPPAEWTAPLLARTFRSALRQHELLCENLRLRGDLKTIARRISHDLRTPVACIYTSSHILRTLPADDVPAIGATIQGIEESSTELSRMIDRVSFVLKASADPLIAAREAMGPRVAAVLEKLEPDIQKAGATVTQPDSWPDVIGVAAWLETIWTNLLDNALEHGGAGGRIQIGWSLHADEYRFTVTNWGPDISPATEAALFHPFELLHAQTSRGLGLSLVQRLVALQGGRCGYERGQDGASVFYFTLPAGVPRHANGTHASAAEYSPSR